MTYLSYSPVVYKRLVDKFAQRAAAGRGDFYNDPAFVEAERRLREEIGRRASEYAANLQRQGISGEDLARRMAPYTVGAGRAFQELYMKQAGIEQQRREAAAERRRQRRARLLGFLASAPFSIANLVMQARDIGSRSAQGEAQLDLLRSLLAGRSETSTTPSWYSIIDENLRF